MDANPPRPRIDSSNSKPLGEHNNELTFGRDSSTLLAETRAGLPFTPAGSEEGTRRLEKLQQSSIKVEDVLEPGLPKLARYRSSYMNDAPTNIEEAQPPEMAKNESSNMAIALTLERNGSLCPQFMRSTSKIGDIAIPSAFLPVYPEKEPEPTMVAPDSNIANCVVNVTASEPLFCATNEEKEAESAMSKPRKKAGRKSAFTPRLEQQLVSLVAQYGENNWSTIAKHMPQFNRKQLRGRYVDFLKKERAEHDFTPEEDEALIQLVDTVGRKWEEIAKMLPGRTAIMLKNRYTTKLRNKKKSGTSVSGSSKQDLSSQETVRDPESMMSSIEEAMSDVMTLTKCASIPNGGKRAWDGSMVFTQMVTKATSEDGAMGKQEERMLSALEAATLKLQQISKTMTA